MSKLQSESLRESIRSVLNPAKKRNFLETVELHIALKGYDPSKDKRFNGSIVLPNPIRAKMNICMLGDLVHCDEAKALGMDAKSQDELKAYKRKKKIIKKELISKYDAFLATDTVIKKITKLLGRGLNRAGKFPVPVTHQDSIEQKVVVLRSTVKFQLKKVTCLSVAIGHLNMTEDELVQNIVMALNFFVSMLKKNWHNVKQIIMCSTMGAGYQIY